MHIIATSVADNGYEYVAIVQDKKYPFYGTQFHPEKNGFEKRLTRYANLDRSKGTMETTAELFNAMVELSTENRKYKIEKLSEIPFSYVNFNFISFPYILGGFESFYIFGDLKEECKLVGPCWKYVTSLSLIHI